MLVSVLVLLGSVGMARGIIQTLTWLTWTLDLSLSRLTQMFPMLTSVPTPLATCSGPVAPEPRPETQSDQVEGYCLCQSFNSGSVNPIYTHGMNRKKGSKWSEQ